MKYELAFKQSRKLNGVKAVQKEGSNAEYYDDFTSVVNVEEYPRSEKRMYSRVKRILDVLFTLVCLPVAMILIVMFSILIILESRGSAFYKQERLGLQGKKFKVIKLRSMKQNAEKHGAVWASKNDSRITRIGTFIRKTRIDELPQFFNVLKGEMSVIGPRPERPIFTAEFEEEYPGFSKRLLVKPGLTGWAQVNGGYEITPKEKLDLDMYYIRKRGFLIDLTIMLKTIRIVLTGDGAR
ncbi:MAG TPA: sugar transferase [Pseudogracilibacillus sp.]|nr:sugar transferase [Pseudogracilibacillus sp.]